MRGIIQAGFSNEAAEEAVRATGPNACCAKQIAFLHERNQERNKALYGGDEEEALANLASRCPLEGDATNHTTSSSSSTSTASSNTVPDCCHMRNQTDMDGIAVVWGASNIQQSAEACCRSCREYRPKPPHWYPCNVWVFCGKTEGVCFTPAAGIFSAGQCWLKYQDEPTHPLVNAAGAYREQYRKQHPTAPSHVEWTAGVIVEFGLHVSNGTWSPRANWR